jgi:peptidoglycan hydrolase-like protein with peptidoglycan-binding domain
MDRATADGAIAYILGQPGANIPDEGSINTEIDPTKSYQFTRDLEFNMTGPDVIALQQFLNYRGFLVSETGPGSKGNETSYFGELTRAALIKFQKANNITPAVGYFGPITRRLANSMIK